MHAPSNSRSPGSPPGFPAQPPAMTKPYVQMVGRMAYISSWALVKMVNRAAGASKATEPVVVGGLPAGYGRLAMLTGYMTPEQRVIPCPNPDLVFGTGFFDLEKEPAVFQVPNFGDRYWIYASMTRGPTSFQKSESHGGTKPGFYLMVGPNWKGETPPGATAVVHSSTRIAFATPSGENHTLGTRFRGRPATPRRPPPSATTSRVYCAGRPKSSIRSLQKLTIYEGIKGNPCADSNTITTAPQNCAIGFRALNRFE